MTGTTVAMSNVVRIAGPGMRTITTGYTTAGMATNGTVGGTSGLTTAMTGTTVTMSTVVGIAGPGMRTITTGYTTVGMATNGTVGECIRNDYRMVTHVRAWTADWRRFRSPGPVCRGWVRSPPDARIVDVEAMALFGVNADRPCVRASVSVVVCR